MSATQTERSIREIIALMQQHCPAWRFAQISAGGHMAPLTRPDLINPIISEFLEQG